MTPSLVFICAAGHAGSTLLNLLLGAHPRAIAVGEITHLPKNISIDSVCSCGNAISKCLFWKSIIDEYSRISGIELWRAPYELNLGFIMDGREIDHAHQTRVRMLRRKITFALEYGSLRWGTPTLSSARRPLIEAAMNKHRLFEFLRVKTNHDLVVDSSKHYIDGVHLYKAKPEQTRIISLVRDGRAVFNSGLRRGLTPKAALSAWTSPYQRSIPVLDKHVASSDLIKIRYEDLATTPASVLTELCDFLGFEFDERMTDIAQTGTHIANGNRMRLRQDSAIRLDERWRKELSPALLRYFNERAGQLNELLGYGE